jgi:hypothetical protein
MFLMNSLVDVTRGYAISITAGLGPFFNLINSETSIEQVIVAFSLNALLKAD